MNLVLVRDKDNHETTVGKFYLEGKLFCATLEDTYRHDKVHGVTRIPAGRYKIELRKEGGMYQKYQTRCGTNGMLWLKNVPNYEYVYIHIGNDDEDTLGCILVGSIIEEKINDDGESTLRVLNSLETYKKLWAKINAELECGPVYISIIDN
jgi:hypothetical protein